MYAFNYYCISLLSGKGSAKGKGKGVRTQTTGIFALPQPSQEFTQDVDVDPSIYQAINDRSGGAGPSREEISSMETMTASEVDDERCMSCGLGELDAEDDVISIDNWVQCNVCTHWLHVEKCCGLKIDDLPEIFVCPRCIKACEVEQ